MKKVTLRMPDDVHARLKAAAAAEHRSIQGQLMTLAETWLAEQDTEQETG
jgi:plasmid stability protein